MDGSPVSPARRMRWSAVLLAGVACLGLAEIGLRAAHHLRGTYDVDDKTLVARERSIWILSDDPLLVYTHKPGARSRAGPLVEAHGILRPRDVSLVKPRGTVRVAVLGDSIAAGLGVTYGERFTTRLEARLRSARELSGRSVEVLNFGIDGYSTLQEARLLETVASRFDPDLVVVQYCLNDPSRSVTPRIWFEVREPPWSELVSLAGEVFGGGAVPVAPVGGVTDEPGHWAEIYREDGPGWREVERGLDRIARYRRESGTPVLVAIFPLLDTSDPKSEATVAFRDQVATAARARGLQVVDLAEAFGQVPVRALQHAPGDVYHPNPVGHGIAAEVLRGPVLGLMR